MTATVEDHTLTTGTGRRIRTATRVVFGDGTVIDFAERLPKGKALEQACRELGRLAHGEHWPNHPFAHPAIADLAQNARVGQITHLLRAWNDGWTCANLAAAVH